MVCNLGTSTDRARAGSSTKVSTSTARAPPIRSPRVLRSASGVERSSAERATGASVASVLTWSADGLLRELDETRPTRRHAVSLALSALREALASESEA